MLVAPRPAGENTGQLPIADQHMAERFGSQQHTGGGERFGSQEYVPLAGVAVGDLAAQETGQDAFAADSYPRIYGAMHTAETGSDTLSASGTSSAENTMQAIESPAPDEFIASGQIIDASLRFGQQEHPLGGLRFGSQSWAALGPSGPMAATESGADTAAAVGWLAGTVYTFAMFDVLASFVSYGSDSLGAAITGTLDTGNKVMLPVASTGGVTLAWEVNEFGNPSLRLADLDGASNLSDVPWYVWDGAAWTAALFDVSDALQGAAFLVEAGQDQFIANGGRSVFGSALLVENGEDFVDIFGGVRAAGAMAATEAGADAFAASGAPGYAGDAHLYEIDLDTMSADGGVIVGGALGATEGAAPDTFAGSGALSSGGTLDATETGADTFAATARLVSTGSLAAVESATPDAAEMAGAVRVTGALAMAEAGADTFDADAEAERLGAAALVEAGADAFAASGAVAIAGALAATDQPDTFASTGQREAEGDVIAAELDALEGGADRFVARGINGEIRPMITFDGPVETVSTTRRYRVTSRRTAEAA